MVRSAIGAGMEDLGFEQRWLVVDIDTSAPSTSGKASTNCATPAARGTYMRVGEVRYRWEFRLGADETAADFATMDPLHPLIAPWTGDVPVDRREISGSPTTPSAPRSPTGGATAGSSSSATPRT